jgi:phosphatidyl-myo-inositol alpha-mannosyltransferase
MRVALVTEYYYPSPGGITEHVYHLGRHLVRRGHDVTVITSHTGEPDGVPQDLRVEHVGRSRPIYSNGSVARCTTDPGALRRLRELLGDGRFDVTHIQSPLVPTIPLLAGHLTRGVCVGTFHTHFSSNPWMRLFQPYLRNVVERLDGAIAVSHNAARTVRLYFDVDCRVIPNGVDVEWFASGRPIERFDDGVPTVLFVGRLDPRNRLEVLLEAFAQVRRHRHARLVVLGDGPARAQYQAMVPRDLRADVHFEGRVLRRQPDYYRSADVFCFTAAIASMPTTVLEAMAAGSAVVAFGIDGIDRVLTHGEDGLIAADGDATAMAVAVETLLDDRALARRLGRNARARAAAHFSWRRLAAEIEGYYHELLERA